MATSINAAYGDLVKSKKYIRETAKTRALMRDEVEGLLVALRTKTEIKALRAFIKEHEIEVKSPAQIRRERDRG